MKTLLVALLLSTSIAAAAPKRKPPPPRTFPAQVAYQSCTTSFAFACGMQDASGNTYGTAHEMQHCEQYTFLPDGTYSVQGFGVGGTYRIVGAAVELTQQLPGAPAEVFTLPLAKDGSTLGGMKRL